MPNDETNSESAGILEDFRDGRLTGWLEPGAVSGGTATVEVWGQGIRFASGPAAAQTDAEGRHPFAIPATRFPGFDLPCELRARVVETDRTLVSRVTLGSLDDLWARMVPFRCRISGVRHGHVYLAIEGEADAPVFEIREGRTVLGVSDAPEMDAEGVETCRIALPDSVFDGLEHRLSVLHRDSGLPVQTAPLSLRLEVQTGPVPGTRHLLARIEQIERNLDRRYGEVFNHFAMQLYRHVDAVTLTQRSNFEREIAALRRLLVSEAITVEPDPEASGTDLPAEAEPSETTIPFDEGVQGYGIHAVQYNSGGKGFRMVAPSWGLLLPGFGSGERDLIIQGLRRPYPEVFDGIECRFNEQLLEPTLYLNPKSESWNITVRIPSGLTRPDSNVLELRLDQPKDPEALARNLAVGILHVRVRPVAPEAEDGGARA